MLSNTWLGIIACAALAGCTNSWIENPSPSTRGLVNDLRLEGFECNARFSEVECVEIVPMRNKQPALCDSKKGCIAQPDVLIYNRYHITQVDSGIPGLTHDLIEKTDDKWIGGSKVIQN
ncbi:hypothetical protein [Pseudomonas sp. MWU12-2323]|uniref:hypothetical protein n=1 Tax=Pseudomonas sp. MWU12-2323 TaxID=2651296 RepID=UPI00128E5929|nr:hypothetical protein [Pseudomonas sp. MWU12-2323]MPQ69247.1 hypothetical protein [Pseudomonas sp. MWU12-2323]